VRGTRTGIEETADAPPRPASDDVRMETSHSPAPLRVVVLGGGVAAAETCLALAHLAGDRVTTTIVAPNDRLELRAASVGEAFGAAATARVNLAAIAADAGAELLPGTASSIDTEERRVHLDDGSVIPYQALVVACGAKPDDAIPGAVTFTGPRDVHRIRAVMEDAVRGDIHRIAFAVPANVGWTLPLYELCLLASRHLRRWAPQPAELSIVTPEAAPLEAFGATASAEVGRILAQAGIGFIGMRTPIDALAGRLRTAPHGALQTDRVIALPKLTGVFISGLPADRDRLLPTDRHGRVGDLAEVYAAGDITGFPVKQGGIATEQADAVAESIAADAGAPIRPAPFRPVLRGLLITGRGDRYLRADLAGGSGETSEIGSEPPWWPPVKTAGRYLGPYLAGLARSQDAKGR
jgi:sulfide:quinone oxidoreductase